MKYKGYELMKAIAEGKIKSGTKFKTKEGKEVKWNGFNLMSIDFNECYMCKIDDICFINEVFELTEDEIDIDSITKSEWMTSSERNFKINQLVQAVKQIDKRVKKLERINK